MSLNEMDGGWRSTSTRCHLLTTDWTGGQIVTGEAKHCNQTDQADFIKPTEQALWPEDHSRMAWKSSMFGAVLLWRTQNLQRSIVNNPEPFQHPLDRQHSTFSHWRRQTSSTSLSQGLTQEISPAWSNNSLQHLACVQKITLWTLGFKLSVWADLQPGLFHHVIHSKFTASISCIFVPSHLTSTPLITFNTYWLSFSVSVNPYQS